MTFEQCDQQPVTLVTVNHNAGFMLLDCARAGLEQAHQVVVVDNDSSDISLLELEASFPSERRLQVIAW